MSEEQIILFGSDVEVFSSDSNAYRVAPEGALECSWFLSRVQNELCNILTEPAHERIAARLQLPQIGPGNVQWLGIGQVTGREIALQLSISSRLCYWCSGRGVLWQGLKERCRVVTGPGLSACGVPLGIVSHALASTKFMS